MISIADALTAIASLTAIIAGVATAVWAVAQIKETTAKLSLQIRFLGEKIQALGESKEDHENRIRKLEDQLTQDQ